jgi:hypothetical protein
MLTRMRGRGTEKQPTVSGPDGCDENGPTAALLVGYVALLPPVRLGPPWRRPIEGQVEKSMAAHTVTTVLLFVVYATSQSHAFPTGQG